MRKIVALASSLYRQFRNPGTVSVKNERDSHDHAVLDDVACLNGSVKDLG